MVGGCAYISDWAQVGGSAKVESLTTLKGYAVVSEGPDIIEN